MSDLDLILTEGKRIRAEYDRRGRQLVCDLYAPWRPETALMTGGARRAAATLLHQLNVFPRGGQQCLEIGCGALGWLGELINWGVREEDLHGIELNSGRIELARKTLPVADLRWGDASELPWDNGSFSLAIASTVFTSILDQNMRRRVAAEVVRVLAPGGALLWYDFAFNNPSNPNVRKVGRSELIELFPHLNGHIESITLAPPLARFAASRSWVLATLLEAIPFLRTHLLAVLVK